MPGFTLLELMVVLVIFGILLAVGVPRMNAWSMSNKAAFASELYAEGLRIARQQALSHNAASRLVLSTNQQNGQSDWQVDLCFPAPGVPCSNESGSWSSTTAIAGGDPEGASGYKSIFRVATALPSNKILVPSTLPEGATSVYFTSLGWVDTNYGQRLSQLRFDPGVDYRAVLRSTALVVTLAGMVSKCDPTVAVTDSRGCPP